MTWQVPTTFAQVGAAARRPRSIGFIGIGAQKCATTWLHAVLRQSPEIGLPVGKEVDFFSHRYDRGIEWYERQVDGAAGRCAGEISPSYLVHPEAAARAAAYNPALTVLVVLRDPVARAYSNHLHEVRAGHVSGDNLRFEAALANNPLYVGQGLYATHLARWFDLFPRERLHVLFQEEIAAEPGAAARKLFSALGLAVPEGLVLARANESVAYRHKARGEAMWRLGEAARRRGLGRLVEQAKAAPGLRRWHAANRLPVAALVPPMLPATEAVLAAHFAAEVAALAALIGRPAPWPRFGGAAPG